MLPVATADEWPGRCELGCVFGSDAPDRAVGRRALAA